MQGKALIVDDEEKEIFQIVLEDEGLTCVFADDGEEALRVVEKERPDVILLDLLMPKVGGEEFLKRMKQMGLVNSVGIIITTGFNDFGATKQRILSSYPVDFYLDKPISNDDLIAKVKQSLEKRRDRV